MLMPNLVWNCKTYACSTYVMVKVNVSLFSVNVVFVKLAIRWMGGWLAGWVGGWVVLAEYKEWLGRAIQYRGCVLWRVRVLGLF